MNIIRRQDCRIPARKTKYLSPMTKKGEASITSQISSIRMIKPNGLHT